MRTSGNIDFGFFILTRSDAPLDQHSLNCTFLSVQLCSVNVFSEGAHRATKELM